jgi:hypothetical protein
MNTRQQFAAIRRLYRIACKLSPLRDEHAVQARVAATSALRQMTGKWDCCEPVRYPGGHTFVVRKHTRLWVKRPFVAAACTRWLASH